MTRKDESNVPGSRRGRVCKYLMTVGCVEKFA